jgi:colicin V production protein/zinc ribbon protein
MAGLALTVLLALLWLAFVALGYWHGGWRQVVLLAGMLLSYAVASEWAAPNGHDLAAQFHWSLPRATTGVGLLYLLGGTLVLGFLGSFALERPYPFTMRERQCGAAMGALNGGLLLALVLRTLRSYAYVSGGGETLRASALSRFLIESIGYVLLVALVLGLVAVVVGLSLTQRRRTSDVLLSEPLPEEAIAPPQQAERQLVSVPAPAPSPTLPRPPTPSPVYAAEPIIDWPSAPPPGTPVESSGADKPTTARPAPEKQPDVTPEKHAPAPALPSLPIVPRRVEPPMRFPVAALIAAAAAPVPAATPTLPPAVPSPVVRPTTPPPGALHPAFVPPTVARPPLSPPPVPPASTPVPVPEPESAPPIVREPDAAPQDAPPPVVREIDVTTQDVPLTVLKNALPLPAQAPADTTSPTVNEPISASPPILGPAAPPPPNAISETTPIPTIIPPPMPPLPARRPPAPAASPPRPATQDEPTKARAGFARVAVARQAGQYPDPSPAPQPPARPEPLQPPLPTGPRVHTCPTCGYPVRDHARFCPNCGTRQRP